MNNNSTEECPLKEELGRLLANMDVPPRRVADYGWLTRNLSVRNMGKPGFRRALEIARRLAANGHE